jgi:TonB family protein
MRARAPSPFPYIFKSKLIDVSIAVKACGLFLLLSLTCALAAGEAAVSHDVARARVAVLDLGRMEEGRRAADSLASSLSSDAGLAIVDREQGRAAALGAGYDGSLNMTLEEARDLGAAIECDFFITGDAQSLRRSPSVGPTYYEAYAAVFIVSARTGRLVMWERPSFEAATPAEAEKLLHAELKSGPKRSSYADAIRRAQESERSSRALLAQSHGEPVIEDAPDDEEQARASGLRLPQPYRRLRPPYTEAAARMEAEATVDVQVLIGADGEVGRIDVVRWAGFGLDEATTETVRRLHFRPAMRGGRAIPMRVLLRYNFRRPPKQ